MSLGISPITIRLWSILSAASKKAAKRPWCLRRPKITALLSSRAIMRGWCTRVVKAR